MRQFIICFLFIILLGFEIPFKKEWSKFSGWCFYQNKIPNTFVCFPKRWGAVDILAMKKIKLSSKHAIFIGYKWTYCKKQRYEFQKAKKDFGHGPYLNFRMRF